MKRLSVLLAVVLGLAFSSNAQDLVSKKGVPILPTAGSYGIGINAAPIMNFVGNIFNGQQGNALNNGFSFMDDNNFISGKYFLEDDLAVRVRFRFQNTTLTNKSYIQKDGQADPLVTVEDKWKNKQTTFGITGGLEWRRGKGRVQGFYGGEFGLGIGSQKHIYEYGNNGFADTNMFPASTDFGDNLIGFQRVTEEKGATQFGFGIRGFVGVEYFFAPQLSVGGEFGYGLGIGTIGDGELTTEEWDMVAGAVKTTTVPTAGGSVLQLDTDNFQGIVYFHFYF